MLIGRFVLLAYAIRAAKIHIIWHDIYDNNDINGRERGWFREELI